MKFYWNLSTYPFAYVLCMAALTLQWQDEIEWLQQKPFGPQVKIFMTQTFKKGVSRGYKQYCYECSCIHMGHFP